MGRTAPEVTSEAVSRIEGLSFVEDVDNKAEWMYIVFSSDASKADIQEVDKMLPERLVRQEEQHPRTSLIEIGLRPPKGKDYELYFLEPKYL